MVEWFLVNTNTTNFQFIDRHKEVKRLSFCVAENGRNRRNGRLWVEDKFENKVLFISEYSEENINGRIIEVRCYAPLYDPSYILYLLIKREGCQIMPLDCNFYELPRYTHEDYVTATAKLLQQIKKHKSYKTWNNNNSD